jgi:CheY-like chemotaxis protein
MFSRLSGQAWFVQLSADHLQMLCSAVSGDKARYLCDAKAIRRGWQRPCLAEMKPLPAILVSDRDTAFREALRNFLLAAGYAQVEVAATVQEALSRLRRERYRHVLIGVSQPYSLGRRLATIAQRRQPEAKIFYLVAAKDQPFIKDATFETVIKEYVYSNLLALM